ncbi:MAG TPA: hypothetical protein VJ724_02920, partial [Tahibacter sp.]|nr:hypothetical protein [Tahibacter sp.]
MRLSIFNAALCVALAGAAPATHAASANDADTIAAKTAAARQLGFDQVGVDGDGRQNALLMRYGRAPGAAAKAA